MFFGSCEETKYSLYTLLYRQKHKNWLQALYSICACCSLKLADFILSESSELFCKNWHLLSRNITKETLKQFFWKIVFRCGKNDLVAPAEHIIKLVSPYLTRIINNLLFFKKVLYRSNNFPAGNCLLKVNTIETLEQGVKICLTNLTIKPLERRHWHRPVVFTVNL